MKALRLVVVVCFVLKMIWSDLCSANWVLRIWNAVLWMFPQSFCVAVNMFVLHVSSEQNEFPTWDDQESARSYSCCGRHVIHSRSSRAMRPGWENSARTYSTRFPSQSARVSHGNSPADLCTKWPKRCSSLTNVFESVNCFLMCTKFVWRSGVLAKLCRTALWQTTAGTPGHSSSGKRDEDKRSSKRPWYKLCRNSNAGSPCWKPSAYLACWKHNKMTTDNTQGWQKHTFQHWKNGGSIWLRCASMKNIRKSLHWVSGFEQHHS